MYHRGGTFESEGEGLENRFVAGTKRGLIKEKKKKKRLVIKNFFANDFESWPVTFFSRS